MGARAVSTTVISVTMTPIIAEPVVNSARLHCIERPDGWRKKSDSRQSVSARQSIAASGNSRSSMFSMNGGESRLPNDPFLLAKEIVAERVLLEEEWLKGKTIQLCGLKENTCYLVRLIANNDAGETHGEIVEV